MDLTPPATSIRADNRYTFRCPVVGRDERWLACAFRRHKHWRGERIEADCATCMNANKCPAVHMLRKEWEQGRPVFVDPTDRVHGLHKDIAARIEKVMIVPSQASGTGITPERLSQLVGARVERVPDSLAVPPSPRAPTDAIKRGLAPRKKATGGDDLAAALDHVSDLADHISAGARAA